MRRYPPDTIPKYSEAKPSKLQEVKVGDQLTPRWVNKTSGRMSQSDCGIEVVFGKRFGSPAAPAGLRSTPQPDKSRLNDLQTKKTFTIILKPESVAAPFPRRWGMMLGGMGPGGPGAQGTWSARPQKQGPETAKDLDSQAPQKKQGPGRAPAQERKDPAEDAVG